MLGPQTQTWPSAAGLDVTKDQSSSTGHSDWHGPRGSMPFNTNMPPDGSPYPCHQYGLWWYQESQSRKQTLAIVGPLGFCFLSLLFQQDKKHSVTCYFHSWLIFSTIFLNTSPMEKYGQFFEYWKILWPFQLSDYQEIILCQTVSQEIYRWAAFISYFWDTCSDENTYSKTKLFTKHAMLWQESFYNLELATQKEKCLAVPQLLFLSQFCL